MKQQVQCTTKENSKEEPTTGFYSKLISNFDQDLTVPEKNLENVHNILTALKFEVFEIWNHEDGKHYEVWGNQNVKLKISVIKNKDADLSDVVKEIDYLFWELRALRDMFSEGVDEEVLIAREKSSEEIFSELVNHFEEMTNLSDLEKKFALQPGIDTETFTYLCMEPEAKREILQ